MRQINLDDIVHLCTCLGVSDRKPHLTDSQDKMICDYCGYYVLEIKVDTAFLNRYKRWLNKYTKEEIEFRKKKAVLKRKINE